MAVTYFDFSTREKISEKKELFKYVQSKTSNAIAISFLNNKFLSGLTLDIRDTSGLTIDDDYLFKLPNSENIKSIFFKMRFLTIASNQNNNMVMRSTFGGLNNDVVLSDFYLTEKDLPDSLFDVQSGNVIALNELNLLPKSNVLKNGCFIFPKIQTSQSFIKAYFIKLFMQLFKPSNAVTADVQSFTLLELNTLSVIIKCNMSMSVLVEYY